MDIQGNEAASGPQHHKDSSSLCPCRRQSPLPLLRGHVVDLGAQAVASKGSLTIAMHMVAWQLLPRACKPHSNQEPLGLGAHLLCKDSFISDAMKHQRTTCASLRAGALPQPSCCSGTLRKDEVHSGHRQRVTVSGALGIP